MFVDASAFVAMIAEELGWERYAAKIEGWDDVITSPLALWEAIVALTRHRSGDFDGARTLVESYLATNNIRVLPITAEIGVLAIEASKRYGRGRHPASLNFGDCFAYACARHHGVPLLFKGEDFSQTDVETV